VRWAQIQGWPAKLPFRSSTYNTTSSFSVTTSFGPLCLRQLSIFLCCLLRARILFWLCVCCRHQRGLTLRPSVHFVPVPSLSVGPTGSPESGALCRAPSEDCIHLRCLFLPLPVRSTPTFICKAQVRNSWCAHVCESLDHSLVYFVCFLFLKPSPCPSSTSMNPASPEQHRSWAFAITEL
jgi:hypothetical protein